MSRLVGWARRINPLTAVALAAIAAYALIGIGSPLWGLKVFAATDLLTEVSPYRDAGLGDTTVQNTYLNDTVDAYLPNIALFVSALREGQLAAWNPYIVGGVPLGASPNLGLANPIALPYFLLPIWLAPAYVKLLEILVAVGGTFLYLRRIGLRRPAALLGGLVFASSGFMVAWTNWPHTRVAAFIPVLFWALERLATRRRITDAALVSLVTAAMLGGGFPAVTGYALLFGGGYFAVRALAERRGELRALLGLGFGAAGAMLAGALLAAVQLTPFVSYMSTAHISGRQQTPGDRLLPETLVTAVAPWAMGSTDPSRPPFWYLHVNLVESMVYVGAGAVVLAVLSLAMPAASRAAAPQGVWRYLVWAAGGLLVVMYVGWLPLALLQQLPVLFAENFVGRARSVLGFLVAALAAIGFQVLLSRLQGAALSRGVAQRVPAAGQGRRAWQRGAGVWLGAGVLGAAAWWDARRAAYATSADDGVPPGERLAQLRQEMLLACCLVLVALAAVAILWWAGRTVRLGSHVGVGGRWRSGFSRASRGSRSGLAQRARIAAPVAAALLPLLIAGQALSLAGPYWPRTERETFYPITDTHRFLAEHLGHERFAGSQGGMCVGADSGRRLRALTGHFFLNGRFAETLDGLPGRQFGDPPTYVNFPAVPQIASHPVLDRLSVKYFVAGVGAPVFGKARAVKGDGSTAILSPERPVTVQAPGTGPVRAVGVTLAAPLAESARMLGASAGSGPRLEVVLRDSSGVEVARNEQPLRRASRDVSPNGGRGAGRDTSDRRAADASLWIPLTGESVGADEQLTATLTLRGDLPLRVRGEAGAVALSTVEPHDDGLRLAYAGSAVVYERLRAVPRIRWASRVRVEPHADRRVALVASGDLAPDEVVLDSPPRWPGHAGDQPGPRLDERGSGPVRPDAAGDHLSRGATAAVRVMKDGLDAIEVAVTAQGSGHLVIGDALQQDWVATVDGESAPLVPADHGLVAVPVERGVHTVRLAYRMPYGNIGAWLTGVTAATLLILVAVELICVKSLTRRRSSSTRETGEFNSRCATDG